MIDGAAVCGVSNLSSTEKIYELVGRYNIQSYLLYIVDTQTVNKHYTNVYQK